MIIYVNKSIYLYLYNEFKASICIIYLYNLFIYYFLTIYLYHISVSSICFNRLHIYLYIYISISVYLYIYNYISTFILVTISSD